MECNRDEAVRSRCIAEQKFLQHDVLGARKFALKAQYLFPDLEGLPQLLAVLDVHSVAQQKIEGADVNWYGILQTDASADDVTIRKQYRKLALILHPDKNKAIGAEAAFKLISEARRVLSDKEKKAAHDARRNGSNGFGSSARKPMRGFYNFSRFNGFCQPTPASGLKKSFWTGCPSCKMQFEFMRVHENKKIPCPTCSKVFRAAEMHEPEPSFRAQPPEQSSWAGRRGCPDKQGQTDGGSRAHASSSHSFHWGPHKFDASKYANAAAQMVQQTYEAVRKERIKAHKEARDKAAKARMEAEIELMKREHKERKQKRKEQREMAKEGHVHRRSQEGIANARCPPCSEPGRAHSGTFMASEEVARENVHMSSLHASSSAKESGSCVGGKAVRLEQMQEPFWCRGRNGFDSTNSHDSSDMFTFSKRLKVDV